MNVTLINEDRAGADQATRICQTSRFGEVSVRLDSIVDFPDGLIGLGGTEYALLTSDPQSPFVWLQSLQQPALALPVTDPHRFFKDFNVELSDEDAAALGLDDSSTAQVYVTVTAKGSVSDFTANLKAPILITGGHGHQVINLHEAARLKAQLFPG